MHGILVCLRLIFVVFIDLHPWQIAQTVRKVPTQTDGLMMAVQFRWVIYV